MSRRNRPCIRTSQDHGPAVVRSAVLGASGFATATVSMLAVAGQVGMEEQTLRYAIGVAGLVAALTQFVAAACVLRR